MISNEMSRRGINKKIGEKELSSERLMKTRGDLPPLYHAQVSKVFGYFFSYIQGIKADKVLFVGAGSGKEILYFSAERKGDPLICSVDIRYNELQRYGYLSKKNNINSYAIEGDGMSLPFADGSFDVAFAFDALHHMDDPGLCLSEMLRVSGTVCVSDRRKCALSRAARYLGIQKPDYDGLYANEINTRDVLGMTRDRGREAIFLKHHLLTLFTFDPGITAFFQKNRTLTSLYTFLVNASNAIFGSFGNGAICVIGRRCEQ
ncbi:class I SAM-dependent methyltransferase [Candidatus Omnitrophota bacterium]